ncbi:MAG: NfeD family protein [Clostridia bacterium]|nr:NfeD family protein [Clostridia bacterium]NLF21062.1 NfeD family protein [Clostridiaceae bacterium]
MDYMWIIWLVLAAAFLIVEMITIALISVWFTAGSLIALIASLLGMSLPGQVALMLVSSIVLLTAFVLLRRKMGILPSQKQATNADALIGKQGEVIQRVDPVENIGQVQVNGQIWSARTDGSQAIEVGTAVKITELRGVKLVVVPFG